MAASRLASSGLQATSAGVRFNSSKLLDPVKLLVIDGYAPSGRKDLSDYGAGEAGHLYRTMLTKCSPVDTEVDIIYPADPDYHHPPAEELRNYDGVGWTGSSLTVHHREDPKVISQIGLARAIAAERIPSFGSCWSVQIAAE
eukprot:388652_1